MGIFAWIVFGFIAGAVARLLHPGRDRLGCIFTTLLGIGGALLGGYIGTRLGWGQVTGFDLRSLGLAVLGAFILLILHRILFGRRRR